MKVVSYHWACPCGASEGLMPGEPGIPTREEAEAGWQAHKGTGCSEAQRWP